MTLDELRQRRAEIERITESHGARNIRIFGSVARGDAVPGSDVDFLVDFDPDRSVLDLSALILDPVQAALGCEVDVKRPAGTVALLSASGGKPSVSTASARGATSNTSRRASS